MKRLRFLTSRSFAGPREGEVVRSDEVTFLPMEAIGDHGELDLSLTRPVEEVQSGYSRFNDGDVVVAKITPCFENGKGALIGGTRTGIGFGTTELHVLTPGLELDGKFLYYVTVDPQFRGLGQAWMTGAAGQQRVPEEFVRDYRILVPSLRCQRTIAAYLDRETARLDGLVAAKEQLLGLVAEKRVALVARAVTRGLDPNAPLRDSGVLWLGEIPAHWRTERAHWLFRERDDRSETGEEELLTISHLTGVTPRSEKDVYMFEAETTEGYKLCMKGDLVINTLWAWMGAMGVSPVKGIVSPSYHVYEPTDTLEPGYIDALVRLPVFAQEVTRHSKGVWSSRLRLYPENFFEVSLPVPPVPEQHQIVSFLEERSRNLDALTVAAEKTIALLKERRAALIAAAVTGKIGVAVAA
jgi:type I restriction enzyme, S subunit